MRRSAFGLHFILGQTQPAAKCRLASTLAISVEESVAPELRRSKVMPTATTSHLGCKYQSLGHLRALESPACNSDGQHRMYWMALRASVLRRAVSQRSSAHERGSRFDLCTATRQGSLAFQLRQRTAPRAATRLCVPLQRAAIARSGAMEIHTASHQAVPPQNGCCFRVFNRYKCAFSPLFSIQALLANQSLNRTLCGGPRLAIISFLAKPGPPQSAG